MFKIFCELWKSYSQKKGSLNKSKGLNNTQRQF